MSRLQHTLLILGCTTLLWLESPRAWNVFAADLGRAIEPGLALRLEAPPALPAPLALVQLASLPPMLWGLRTGARTTATADVR